VLEDGSWPRRWDRTAVEAELSFLDDAGATTAGDSPNDDGALPASLPLCAQFVARRLQLEILQEELPHLARAIRLDRESGATTTAEASDLANQISGSEQVVEPACAARLFLGQQIGRERIADEVGTDPFVKIVATAAAVAASVAHEASAPIKPLQPLLRIVRGLLLGFCLTTLAATGGDFARTLFVALLAAGGALVAVGAFSSGLTSAVFLVGIALLTAGAVSALVRGTKLAVLGGLLLVGLAVAAGPDVLAGLDLVRNAQPFRPVAVTGALVLFGFLLGRVGASRGKPAPAPP